MSRQILSMVGGLFLLLGVAACDHPREEERPKPKRHTVRMEGMVFMPAALEVAAGDTVVWVNKDLVPHAATTAGFDSKAIEFNQSYRHTFSTPGEFEYVCPFHPTMKGKVQVR
jgi:plastocyanin